MVSESKQGQSAHICEDATTENWKDNDLQLTVSQPAGYMVKISLLAKVPLSPHTIFNILTDPGNGRIFKAVKGVKSRKVLYNDGNRQLIEVEQIGEWRFLVFRGTFTTKLRVEQDAKDCTIKFHLYQPGFMRRFQGSWVIKPFSQDSLDVLANHKQRSHHHFEHLRSSLSDFKNHLLGREAPSSLVQLEQSLLPALVPPPPTDKLLTRIAGKQVMNIMDDLLREAKRINDIGQQNAGREVEKPDAKELLAHSRKL